MLLYVCDDYCVFLLSVYNMFLQYFDTVGWVFCPAKTVSHITYTVLAGTAQSNPISRTECVQGGPVPSHFHVLLYKPQRQSWSPVRQLLH